MPDNPATPTATSGQTSGSQDALLLRRLLRAKDRMDAFAQEDWPIQRLARVSGVSEAHFARAFRQAFGTPPHRYLLTRRIERAKTLLRDTDLAVTAIAFDTGWSSLGSFGRTFRDVTERVRGLFERARGTRRPRRVLYRPAISARRAGRTSS